MFISVKELTTLDAACIALGSFAAFLSANPHLPSSVVDKARDQAQDFPTHVQLLYELLLIRQAEWKRAETFSQAVFGYAQRMSLILREGLRLFLYSDQMIERGMLPDPKFTAPNVEHAVAHSKIGVAELTWIIRELMEFQALATSWSAA